MNRPLLAAIISLVIMQTSFAMDDIKIEDLECLYGINKESIKVTHNCDCNYNKQDYQREALVYYHLGQTTAQIREKIRQERAQHPKAPTLVLGPVSTTVTPITAAMIEARQKEKKPEPIPLRVRRFLQKTSSSPQPSTSATNTLPPTKERRFLQKTSSSPQPSTSATNTLPPTAAAVTNNAKPAADPAQLPSVPPRPVRPQEPAPSDPRIIKNDSRKRPLPSPASD